MGDPINAWRQVGVIHLWRYKPEKSGLKGWHMTADQDGLSSVIALVELLLAATYAAKRTLRLARPSKCIIRRPFSPLGDRRVVAPRSLQLSVHANGPEDYWQLDEEGEKLKLSLGRQSVVGLLDGLRVLKEQRYGDFSIGPARGEPPQNIWFW